MKSLIEGANAHVRKNIPTKKKRIEQILKHLDKLPFNSLLAIPKRIPEQIDSIGKPIANRNEDIFLKPNIPETSLLL